MDNSNSTDSVIQPLEKTSELKDYRYPHYGKFLFKGNVTRLNMVCHHCQQLIPVDEKDLLN